MQLLFALALLPVAAFGFSDTHPLLAWSSHGLPSTSSKASDFLGNSLESSDICRNDAILLVDHAGLHATDLRSLPSSGPLARALTAANHTVQYPYVYHVDGGNPFAQVAEDLAERCGARFTNLEVEDGSNLPGRGKKEKHVMCITMPPLEGVHGAERKNAVNEHASQLSSILGALTEAYPRHLVIYTGWSPSILARQLPPNPFSYSLTTPSAKAFAPPQGGILSRYQLLTAPLILGFILAFGVLVPLMLFGIFAIASIQSPVRNDPPKQWMSGEKKNQ